MAGLQNIYTDYFQRVGNTVWKIVSVKGTLSKIIIKKVTEIIHFLFKIV